MGPLVFENYCTIKPSTMNPTHSLHDSYQPNVRVSAYGWVCGQQLISVWIMATIFLLRFCQRCIRASLSPDASTCLDGEQTEKVAALPSSPPFSPQPPHPAGSVNVVSPTRQHPCRALAVSTVCLYSLLIRAKHIDRGRERGLCLLRQAGRGTAAQAGGTQTWWRGRRRNDKDSRREEMTEDILRKKWVQLGIIWAFESKDT